ncbi:MAG: efflux RND transporter periplasmic adaptor subunit [Planctomycetes bacterium]|nr:efflux RND transporter periplasmic adaptor subunit [Planctomycetota bacterium]
MGDLQQPATESTRKPAVAHRWRLVIRFAVLAAIVVAGGPLIWTGGTIGTDVVAGHDSKTAESHPRDAASRNRVEVVQPVAGGHERVVVLPGTVRAFDSAQLYARASGFLKALNVDIGDHVTKGQVLAELDVPELVESLQRHRAQLVLAEAQVKQSASAIQAAVAEAEVASTMVQQAEAEMGRATAAKSLREKQHARLRELNTLKAIDARLVDEKQDEHEAAISAEDAARAKIATAKSQVVAAGARVEQAKANLLEAQAMVTVAQADVQKAEVLLQFSKIVSPYEGVITERNFHVGDFIQSADQGGGKPILQVQKIDVMRLVVQVPDRDVAFVDAGDPAEFQVDGLVGVNLEGKVSRFSNSEDERTRCMRTEIDLPNPGGRLRDGMYGQVRIHLQEPSVEAVHVPSACLIGSVKKGNTKVYVCKAGKLELTPVRVGFDDGVKVEVVEGLSVDSQVVFAPGGDLTHGSTVEPIRKGSAAH